MSTPVPGRYGSHLSRWSTTKFEIDLRQPTSFDSCKHITHSEHLRLLHAGPSLVAASLNRLFHIIGGRTRSCVTCRRKSLRPEPPMMGQLPLERATPDIVFDRVDMDYAGPILIKCGYTWKPVML